jgi:phosphotriesterase-related protein
MTTIPTVSGEINVNDLGVTLMHEHIFVRTPELQEAFPGFMDWDDEYEIARANARLKQLKDSGVDTIVDMTVPGLGREVKRIARAVEGTGLQVILVTGFYTYADLPFPLKYNGPGKLFDDPGDELLVSLFVGDVEDGIQGTDIKAAALKCCTDEPGVTEDIERIIRAVAQAHLRTDAPIVTHTHARTRRGSDQQRILSEEGVDLTRVLIGHSNETDDLDYLMGLMEAGSYIGFDRCGLSLNLNLDLQIKTLAELCLRGYAEKIVLSHDRHCRSDWFREADLTHVMPNWDYDYIQRSLIPAIQELGVSDADIEQMTSANPKAFFGARLRRSAGAPGQSDRSPA